jgi:hypothetical protein
MLFLALAAAGCLLVAANLSARSRMGFGGVVALAVAFFFVVPMLLGSFFPSVAISCLLLAVFAIICRLSKVGPRLFHVWSPGLVVLSFVIAGIVVVPKIQRFAELREQHPFESLRSRLAYEEGHPRLAELPSRLSSRSSVKTAAGEFASADDRLVQMESAISDGQQAHFRSFVLRKYHQSSVQHFIDSAGFGVGRMIRTGERDLHLPETSAIRMPAPTREMTDREGTPAPGSPAADATVNRLADGRVPRAAGAAGGVLRPQASGQLWDMHLTGAADFVNADGFGYVKNLDSVAGFQSHQFRNVPEAPIDENHEQAVRWLVTRLQLVSLLKHDTPRVYVTENLPRMEEIVTAPTRSLSAFERSGLRALDRGDDLSTDEGPGRIRMLGSLRATKQCLECHNAKRGHLLGALSYELVRDPRPKRKSATHLDTL